MEGGPLVFRFSFSHPLCSLAIRDAAAVVVVVKRRPRERFCVSFSFQSNISVSLFLLVVVLLLFKKKKKPLATGDRKYTTSSKTLLGLSPSRD